MSDPAAAQVTLAWRSVPVDVRALALVVLVVLLLVAPLVGGLPGAVGTVGVVLAESLVLYVGYGALIRAGAPVVQAVLGID